MFSKNASAKWELFKTGKQPFVMISFKMLELFESRCSRSIFWTLASKLLVRLGFDENGLVVNDTLPTLLLKVFVFNFNNDYFL